MKKFAPTLIVAGLLAATATAFAVTERLKLEDSPVLGTRITALFSPKSHKNGEAIIRFRLRREEDIRLDIVDDQGTVVRRALGTGVFGAAFHQFAWDGRNDAGQIVPDGVYHVQLQLKDEDRTIEFPSTVRVDSTPPTIEKVETGHRLFSPDGDHRADHVNVHYTFNEQAYAILYVDGKRVGQSYRKKAIGSYPWYGHGKRPGDYRLALAARDLAGNKAPARRASSPSGSGTSTSSSTSSRLAAGSFASGSRPTRRPSAGGSGERVGTASRRCSGFRCRRSRAATR